MVGGSGGCDQAIDELSVRALYPSPERLTSYELKQFLMLDPTATVHGFDDTRDKPMTRLEWLTQASRWPDDDERNRRRYLRDPKLHAVIKASDGSGTQRTSEIRAGNSRV